MVGWWGGGGAYVKVFGNLFQTETCRMIIALIHSVPYMMGEGGGMGFAVMFIFVEKVVDNAPPPQQEIVRGVLQVGGLGSKTH